MAQGVSWSPVTDLTALRTVQMGYSFEAIDTSKGDKRVGCMLNVPVDIDVESPLAKEFEALEVGEEIKAKTEFLGFVKSKALDIIQERYKTDRCLLGTILSVLPEYGGQGIGQRLLATMREVMTELGISVAFGIYTSAYSAKIVTKRGLELVYKLNYNEYLKDGVTAFKCNPPHDAVQVYVEVM